MEIYLKLIIFEILEIYFLKKLIVLIFESDFVNNIN